MRLYEIADELYDALKLAAEGETSEDMASTMEGLKVSLDEKLEACWMYIKNLEADAEALKNEEKRLAKKRASAERRIESYKQYVGYCLQGSPWKHNMAKFAFRKSEKCLLKPGAIVPECYLKEQAPKVDLAQIKQDIKEGADLSAFAEVVTYDNLQVK